MVRDDEVVGVDVRKEVRNFVSLDKEEEEYKIQVKITMEESLWKNR